MIKNIVMILFILCSIPTLALAAEEWNGGGKIKNMWIYPSFLVVEQGPTKPGSAGCVNDNKWSFNWSDVDKMTQNRIQAALLTAYAQEKNIDVRVDKNSCGPESRKKFTGNLVISNN